MVELQTTDEALLGVALLLWLTLHASYSGKISKLIKRSREEADTKFKALQQEKWDDSLREKLQAVAEEYRIVNQPIDWLTRPLICG